MFDYAFSHNEAHVFLENVDLLFLMTESICHSSLRRAVLETVALTFIKFCINPRKKVDHVCILVRH